MADADETPGQDMEEEAAQELDGVEGHDALISAVAIIAPAEADVSPSKAVMRWLEMAMRWV